MICRVILWVFYHTLVLDCVLKLSVWGITFHSYLFWRLNWFFYLWLSWFKFHLKLQYFGLQLIHDLQMSLYPLFDWFNYLHVIMIAVFCILFASHHWSVHWHAFFKLTFFNFVELYFLGFHYFIFALFVWIYCRQKSPLWIWSRKYFFILTKRLLLVLLMFHCGTLEPIRYFLIGIGFMNWISWIFSYLW